MAKAFTLRVGHLDILVEPVSHELADKEEMHGCYLSSQFKIQIRHPYPPAEQARVLIHELIHAVYDVWRYTSDKSKDEESVCESLDIPLVKILQDNPQLLDRLKLAVGAEQVSPFEFPS